MRERTRFWWSLALVPIGLAVLCAAASWAVPADSTWGVRAQVVLMALPRWLMLLYVPWAVAAAVRTRAPAGPLLAGLVGLALAGIPWPAGPAEGLRVAFSNVLYKNTSEKLEQRLGVLDADLLVTMERDVRTIPGMRRVADNAPAWEPWATMSVYCGDGVSCDAIIAGPYGTDTCPMPIAVARLEARLCVVGLHVPPASPSACPEARTPYLAEVASHVHRGRMADDWGPCHAGDPVVVGGDLNAVPGNPVYVHLMRQGLTDPFLVHGVFAQSFPSGGTKPSLAAVRIDHLLAGDVEVRGARLIDVPDTDHKTVFAGIRPRGAEPERTARAE